MTDNKIIQAMNYCCGNIKSDEECSEDMCYQVSLPEGRNGDIRWCRQWLIKDALDLIDRQKAEIERLKKKNKILIKNADTAFQDGLDENRDLFKKEVEPEIRAEAIKEFAERLKEKADDHVLAEGEFETMIFADDIDNLVKEMTEGE